MLKHSTGENLVEFLVHPKFEDENRESLYDTTKREGMGMLGCDLHPKIVPLLMHVDPLCILCFINTSDNRQIHFHPPRTLSRLNAALIKAK